MKKLIYILLSISIFLFRCKNTKPIFPTTKEIDEKRGGNIALYYELINEAELALIRDKYAEAVDYYLAANEEGVLFVKDVENALLVAVEAKKYTEAVLFAEKLLEKGVPKSYFEQRKTFQQLRQSEAWKALVAEKKEYKVNVVLKERIMVLLALDQQYRYDDYYKDTMLVIDSIIKQEILDIFEKEGYPNANVIGVFMKNDTTIRRNQFDLLLISQVAQNPNLWVSALESFLQKGQLSNHFFEANGKMLYPSDNNFKLSCLGAKQNLFIQVKDELYTCCCTAELAIDSIRKKFYLEPLKEVRLKAEFYYERDRRFGFGGCAFKYTLRKSEKASTVTEALAKEGFVLHKKIDAETPYFR